MPLNHASLQRFSFTILPNASRLDFSSTLLTFYNTTRPLTLLHNISTCENAKKAGFLVRSPQGSNIQHVSICKIPPNSAIRSVLTDFVHQQPSPNHTAFSIQQTSSLGAWKSITIITILQPSPRNQHNQHTGLPQMWSLICSSETSFGLLGIAEAPAPMALELEMCSMVTTVRSLGPNY